MPKQQLYLQREATSVMLASTAYAYTTWKQSTCWCLCQINISIDVSVLSQRLPNPVQSRALLLLLASAARQLLDYRAKQLLVSFCNRRNWQSCWPSEYITSHQKEPSMISDGVKNPHSVAQFLVHKSRERKARGQQHNQYGIFTYLAFLSNLLAQQSEDCFQKEKLRTSLEKLVYHGNCNLLVTLPQIYTLGNYFRF